MQNFYIVTPCLNAAEFISQTIISVITQAGSFNLHYHIQDGGSTDGTINILEDWNSIINTENCPLDANALCGNYNSSVVPPNIVRLISQSNLLKFSYRSENDHGMYDAVNKGFDYLNVDASGIMSWINADDIYFQGAFATVAEAMDEIQAIAWLGGATSVMTESSGFLTHHWRFNYPQKLIQSGLCDGKHWTFLQQEGVFWKKWLWDKVGGLDSRLKYAGDYELWRQFSQHADFIQARGAFGAFRKRRDQLSEKIEKYYSELEQLKSTKRRNECFKDLKESLPISNDVKLLNRTADKPQFRINANRLLYPSQMNIYDIAFAKRENFIVRVLYLIFAKREKLLLRFLYYFSRIIERIIDLRLHTKDI